MSPVTVKRSDLVLHPDRRRVLARPFQLASRERAARICAQVMALPESEVRTLLEQVENEFRDRHVKTREFLLRRFDQLRPWLRAGQSDLRRTEIAARRVLHPRVFPGSGGVVQSLHRAAPGPVGPSDRLAAFHPESQGHGRGAHLLDHVSHGPAWTAGDAITIRAPTRYCLEPDQLPSASYEKALFARKLQELGLVGDFTRQVLESLGDAFTLEELRTAIRLTAERLDARDQESTAMARKILVLAQSNYEVQFAPDTHLSERVLFPVTPSQSNGIEDARFVRFLDEDGTWTYYATYTAYDGKMILPQFIETRRLPPLQVHHAERSGGAEQGHGALSAEDQRRTTRCWAGRTTRTST